MDTFSWDTLTSQPASTDVLDALSAASLLIFGNMFIVVSALALWPRFWGLRRRIGRERYGRWLSAGLWLSSMGLIFPIIRFLQIDPLRLSRPIWLVVVLIGVAVWIGWLVTVVLGEPAPIDTPRQQAYRRPRKGGSYR